MQVEIKNLTVKSGQRVILEENEFHIYTDIVVEEGGELVIKNATLKFFPDAGIVVTNGTFVVENSRFLPRKKLGWKHVVLTGNLSGYIKDSFFKNPNGGNLGSEISTVTGLSLNEEKTYGGVLIIHNQGNESFVVENCTFERCSADFGGAIYATENITIKNCTFKDCSANWGGGVYVIEGNLIENSTFENCSASSEGGGIYAIENNLIKNSVFKNCTASYGGGIYAFKNNLIENSTFENCSASYGGGVYVDKNNLIEHSIFRNCSALKNGGCIYAFDNNQIENSIFEKCSAKEYGGGIFAESNNTIRLNEFYDCKSYGIVVAGAKYTTAYDGYSILGAKNIVFKNYLKNCDVYPLNDNIIASILVERDEEKEQT